MRYWSTGYVPWSIFGPPHRSHVTPHITTGTLGNNGWCTSAVSVTWITENADSTSGCDPVSLITDTPGLTIEYFATNNINTYSQQLTLKRDATPPGQTVTGVTAGKIYPGDANPSCSSQDARSGLFTAASLNLIPFGPGSYTATCSGAVDAAGNVAASVNVSNPAKWNPWTAW